MKNKKIILPAFIVIALIQLYVPSKMIWDREEILETGIDYKFKTAPVDPNDPFRGKYFTLNFDENIVKVQKEEDWVNGETIHVLLKKDNDGFAKITSVSRDVPTEDQEYVKARVGYVTTENPSRLFIDYPFKRFYMPEPKAIDAEETYRQSALDTTQVTYALVKIKGGEAVLKDIYIDEVPIKELIQINLSQN